MKLESERHIFNSIVSGHKGMYFLSVIEPGHWPRFFHVNNDKIYRVNTVSIGWSNEGPGDELIEQLEHITVKSFSSESAIIEFENDTKKVEFTKPANHYYGR